MISADTVIIGADPRKNSSPAPSVRLLATDDGDGTGNNLPLRNPVFAGREEALAQVGRQLARGPVAMIAIRGLGGVGKSQIALEYAHRAVAAGRYRLAWWVRADSAVTIAEDLAALASVVGVAPDQPAGDVAVEVVARLRSRHDWLVVFDNAQVPGDLSGVLPGGDGHVLITSRNRGWSGLATQLDVEVFQRAESVAFLCERARRAEPGAAAELAEELGDLPLALAQAAAYIDARSVTIKGYLGLYRDPVLARRLRDEGLESDEYPASVARTWLLSIGQLSCERPGAVELLRLCAFLDPDDIDLDLLATGAVDAGDHMALVLGERLDRVETIGALTRASLIAVTAEGRLRVHRLVQAVTRDQLDEDQAAGWARRALSLVESALPADLMDYRAWPVCASLAPHIEAVTRHTDCYPDLAIQRGRLLVKLGQYLERTMQLQTALTTLGRALAINEEAHGSDCPEVASTLVSLGSVQFWLGELVAASVTLERALAIFEASYGPDHPRVAYALTTLGDVQTRLGDLLAARATLERALAINEAALGPDDPHVAVTLTSLGIVQSGLGQLPAARATLERALAIFEAAYGPDHIQVAITLDNLGDRPSQAAETTGRFRQPDARPGHLPSGLRIRPANAEGKQ